VGTERLAVSPYTTNATLDDLVFALLLPVAMLTNSNVVGNVK